MYELKPISIEQQKIIDSINNNNVIVDSVAGSGKTTTSLYIAKTYNNKSILLLTYSKRLKEDSRNKIKFLKLDNIEVHSFHSFCLKYYVPVCKDDNGLNHALNVSKPKKPFSFDIIIIDEVQDVIPLYYKLICRIISDNNKDVNICVIGDKHQNIYSYKKADERYITLADKIFDINKLNWDKLDLSVSFRVTKEIGDFVNNCMLNHLRIHTIKKGIKPRYLICNYFGNDTYNEIIYYKNKGYNDDDIFILAPSIRSSVGKMNPIARLSNKLNKKGFLIFRPLDDDSKIDEDEMKNKIAILSFHQAKGLERKVVIVFNFDKSYFKFYNKNEDNENRCPNTLYVATTRALECLSVLHSYENDYLPFINKEKLSKYVDVISNKKFDKFKEKENKFFINISVLQLLRHLTNEVINNALLNVDIKCVNKENHIISIPTSVKQTIDEKEITEDVSAINGIAIPSYFELTLTKSMKIYNELIYANIIKPLNIKKISIHNLLHLAILYDALTTQYDNKLHQIRNYNWLSKEQIKQCVDRLRKENISLDAKFETQLTWNNRNIIISGIIDCIDRHNIWEFKCTSSLTSIHKLQLACYMLLYKFNNTHDDDKFYLFNIITGEKYEISATLDKLVNMMNYLVYEKYKKEVIITDEEFINEMNKIKNKYTRLMQ